MRRGFPETICRIIIRGSVKNRSSRGAPNQSPYFIYSFTSLETLYRIIFSPAIKGLQELSSITDE